MCKQLRQVDVKDSTWLTLARLSKRPGLGLQDCLAMRAILPNSLQGLLYALKLVSEEPQYHGSEGAGHLGGTFAGWSRKLDFWPQI